MKDYLMKLIGKLDFKNLKSQYDLIYSEIQKQVNYLKNIILITRHNNYQEISSKEKSIDDKLNELELDKQIKLEEVPKKEGSTEDPINKVKICNVNKFEQIEQIGTNNAIQINQGLF